jgi:large subunit ribosomal protein L13Ae
MLPYKTCRGREALKRVRGFEGVPPRYQRVKKQVAPHAMRVICLAPGRKVMFFISFVAAIFNCHLFI